MISIYRKISCNAVSHPRGFTLLVALIFVSVILSVGLALTDIAYKQVILASTAQQSQYAFYNADSALECALEQDQQYDTFDYTNEPVANNQGPFMCEGQAITFNASAPVVNSPTTTRTTTFNVACQSGGTLAQVSVLKSLIGSAYKTTIYAGGFNDCNPSDPQRVERGLQSHY
jgi:Tfp pilus assembly protein PilE